MSATHDLIYCHSYDDYRAMWSAAEQIPGAVVTDASDFVHEHRFEVAVPNMKREVYLQRAARTFGERSLALGLAELA